MSRTNDLLRILAVITLASALLSASAAGKGTLLLDGKFTVEDGGMTGATVTVYKDAVPMQEITKGLRHFALELELGHTYLLAFTKPGCVTKELQLDARTPGQFAGSRFTFLFEMTLKAAEGDYAYDAPVAVIHFDNEDNAFTYDRTHAKPKLVHSSVIKAQRNARREVRPFQDPTAALAVWVEEKRAAQ